MLVSPSEVFQCCCIQRHLRTNEILAGKKILRMDLFGDLPDPGVQTDY